MTRFQYAMLCPLVLYFFAILVSVSPFFTLYAVKLGPGDGVGRKKDGDGVGPEGVGSVVADAVADASGKWLWRNAGSGTQATSARATTIIPEPHDRRIGPTMVTHPRPRGVGQTGVVGSIGVGAWRRNSAARASPSAAVATRSRPPRLAT